MGSEILKLELRPAADPLQGLGIPIDTAVVWTKHYGLAAPCRHTGRETLLAATGIKPGL